MSNDVIEVVSKFNEALVSRDADVLKSLTSAGLSYGHSKGKIEDQEGFINNLVKDGATQFVTINTENQTVEVVGDNAIVRHLFKAETSKNGTAGSVEINNLLVWQKAGDQWVLIARQAFTY